MSWHAELRSVIGERAVTPFRWGKHDCCLFAADCIKAKAGEDLAAAFRGAYKNRREAARLLREVGGLAGAASRVGPEVNPQSAEDGDIGIVFDGRHDVLSVCCDQKWFAPAGAGLAVAPFESARRVWRVECRK